MTILSNSTKKPIIWTIAGADCSGGAGIAADIKTGHSLSVEVCALITANTVQNSKQLHAVNPVSCDILSQQVAVLSVDKPPKVIKIGLIANNEQALWLSDCLPQLKQQFPLCQVVYDPVGQASVGGALSSLSNQQIAQLLPLIDVITPNLLEAQQLADNNSEQVILLAEKIQQLGVKKVIIKGGHSHGDTCLDYCLDSEAERNYQLSSARINSNFTHGGGCSFASAISAFLAHGYLLRDAFALTKAYINKGLSSAPQTNYYGAFEQTSWPTAPEHFATINDDINQQHKDLAAFPSLNIAREKGEKLGLYPVVDSIDWLARLLPLNLEIIQLRLKNHSPSELAALIEQAVALSQHYKTRLFINDHWQLAIKYGAYGVHIGQEDLQSADLARISQAQLRLGISTHGCYEFLLAQQLQPSYLAIGAIFPTKTKDMTGQIQGIENLSQLLKLNKNIPVVAIGGINLARAPKVWQTGVDSLAVVTAITEAKAPEQAVASFQQLMNN